LPTPFPTYVATAKPTPLPTPLPTPATAKPTPLPTPLPTSLPTPLPTPATAKPTPLPTPFPTPGVVPYAQPQPYYPVPYVQPYYPPPLPYAQPYYPPPIPYYPPEPQCHTIADIVCRGNELEKLCEAVGRAGMLERFRGGSKTLFAPTNDAFDFLLRLTEGRPDLTPDQLVNLLLFHEVPVAKTYQDLPCDEWILMSNGEYSFVYCRGYDDKYQLGQGNNQLTEPKIILKDVHACNGVIHVISHVMLPKWLAL